MCLNEHFCNHSCKAAMIAHPPTLWAGTIDSKAVGAERPHGQFYSFALQSCKICRNKAPNVLRSDFVNTPDMSRVPKEGRGFLRPAVGEIRRQVGRALAFEALTENGTVV